MKKKILLTAINAKYIHSNLAVYSLRAYARKAGFETELVEYTINQLVDDIIKDLYLRSPDVLCVSCYLWNISYVGEILCEIRKVLPDLEIWVGGPEVSFHTENTFQHYPMIRGIMRGEGEETFAELVRAIENGTPEDLYQISGISFREGDRIIDNPDREEINLSQIPFVYENLEDFTDRIIYYESSRGCPFSCSYCLSSIDKRLRFRDMELVKRELLYFIEHQVPQVKFVDRTFNCRADRTLEIWRFLLEHDQGITNFHFEIAADLLTQKEVDLIAQMRPGLIQLEIGVQSTNGDTIHEIRRVMDFKSVASRVHQIKDMANVHQHLDLIAGLPYEDYESFRESFNQVYALKPDQLQLGFLKVLKGSYMEEMAPKYELVYQDRPPFEVLSTKWLSYADVIRLKGIEDMVEVYYNSAQFVHTISALEAYFPNAFTMFEELAAYYDRNQLSIINHSRAARYRILLEFMEEQKIGKIDELQELLALDMYLRENVKNRPDFLKPSEVTKEDEREFYDCESISHEYLKGYDSYDKRQLRRMTHLEKVGGKLLLFDYQNRDYHTNQARVIEVRK